MYRNGNKKLGLQKTIFFKVFEDSFFDLSTVKKNGEKTTQNSWRFEIQINSAPYSSDGPKI